MEKEERQRLALRMQVLEERNRNMSKANAYLRERLADALDELRVLKAMREASIISA
jgi:hypothetical protein